MRKISWEEKWEQKAEVDERNNVMTGRWWGDVGKRAARKLETLDRQVWRIAEKSHHREMIWPEVLQPMTPTDDDAHQTSLVTGETSDGMRLHKSRQHQLNQEERMWEANLEYGMTESWMALESATVKSVCLGDHQQVKRRGGRNSWAVTESTLRTSCGCRERPGIRLPKTAWGRGVKSSTDSYSPRHQITFGGSYYPLVVGIQQKLHQPSISRKKMKERARGRSLGEKMMKREEDRDIPPLRILIHGWPQGEESWF